VKREAERLNAWRAVALARLVRHLSSVKGRPVILIDLSPARTFPPLLIKSIARVPMIDRTNGFYPFPSFLSGLGLRQKKIAYYAVVEKFHIQALIKQII